MNTYILNGTMEIAREHASGDRVLVCNFAWSTSKPSLREKYYAWKGHYEIAELHKFCQQTLECDILVLNGGDSPTLINNLRKTGWFHTLDNKVILAYSAGISALTKASYNFDHHKIVNGLGMLDYTSIVHWTGHNIEQWHGAYELIDKFSQYLFLPVRDDEYYVIER